MNNMNKISISEYIESKYDKLIMPGRKGECPFCSKPSFSIKRDGTIGKCFHADCGKYITVKNINTSSDYKRQIFQKIYEDFHRELLHLNDKSTKTAYHYLINTRKIHPQVIKDSFIGAIPLNYNVKVLFSPFIKKINNQIDKHNKKLMQIDNLESKNRKEIEYQKNTLLKKLFELEELQKNFKVFLKSKTDDLVLFYTDKYHNITRIKTRKPNTKRFSVFIVDKVTIGLFNHQLFSYDDSEKAKNPILDNMIVVEGEFNQLQLQSLMLNCDKNYVNSCAVGGVLTTDYKTIKELSKNIFICYDNDSSKAGYKLVSRAKEYLSFKAFTTPHVDSDLDSFIISHNQNYNKALEEINKLIILANDHCKEPTSLKEAINSIRQNISKQKNFVIEAEVAKNIIEYLSETGTFYYNNISIYYFFKPSKCLIEVTKDNIELRILLNKFGLNPSESLFNYVLQEIIITAKSIGKKSEIHVYCYYNKSKNIIYLHNNDDTVLKITTSTIKTVENGTDNILFLKNNSYEAFDMIKINLNKDYLEDLLISNINFDANLFTINEYKLLFRYWFFSLFFESLLPTKVILALIGEKGCGKTTTPLLVGKYLFGQKFQVTPIPSSEDNMDTAVSNNYFLALDNADCKIPWLNDKLACIATGQCIRKRKLYTTNEITEIPTKTFLAITSRTPKFTRDDVADRLLIVKLKRFEYFKALGELLTQSQERRDEFMSYILYELQKILKALEVKTDPNLKLNLRMGDFASFGLKIANYEGKKVEIEQIFAKISQEQNCFVLENDVLVDLLNNLLDKNNGYVGPIDAKTLFNELSKIAVEEGIKDFFIKSTRSLAQTLKNLRSNLASYIEMSSEKGRSNKILYTFKRIEEIHDD